MKRKSDPDLEFMFGYPGCGWDAGRLNDPDGPVLVLRLAAGFAQLRRIWETSAPAERQDFHDWLQPER